MRGEALSRRNNEIHRVDSTAKPLIAEAKAYGAKYLPLNGIIDGILLFKDLPPLLIDWKAPKGKRTERQMRLVNDGWPIWFITNSDELRTLLFRKSELTA